MIEFFGGEMPLTLSPTDRVFVRFRDGRESKVRVAGELRWAHDGLADDIVAYRYSHAGPDDGAEA